MATPRAGTGSGLERALSMARASPSAAMTRSRHRGACGLRACGSCGRCSSTRFPLPHQLPAFAHRDQPFRPCRHQSTRLGRYPCGQPAVEDGAEEGGDWSSQPPIIAAGRIARSSGCLRGGRTGSCCSPDRSGTAIGRRDGVSSWPPWCASHARFESGMIDVSARLSCHLGEPAARSPDRAVTPAGAAGNVAIVVYDGVGMFELGVACDVFGSNDLADLGLPWYRLFICGAGGAPVTADGGLRIHPPFGLERTRRVETRGGPPDRPARGGADRGVRRPAPRARTRMPHRLALHGRVRPGGSRPARRSTSHHALDGV